VRVLRRALGLATALPTCRNACGKAFGEQCADQGGWPGGAANGDQPTEEALADHLREEGASGGSDQRHGERGALSEESADQCSNKDGEPDEEWRRLKHAQRRAR
jgi:hypothetical protein